MDRMPRPGARTRHRGDYGDDEPRRIGFGDAAGRDRLARYRPLVTGPVEQGSRVGGGRASDLAASGHAREFRDARGAI